MAPDTDSVTRTYSAKITIVGADVGVRLGMTGKVLVALPGQNGLRRLPLTAIYDTGGKPRVWIVGPKTHTVSTRDVTLAQAQKAAVLGSAGLRDGDIVVTAGVNLLHPWQKVRLSENAVAGARSWAASIFRSGRCATSRWCCS